MKKTHLLTIAALALATFALTPSSRATLLLTDDFTGYTGNLDGNTGGSPSGLWTKAGSGPAATIASATPLTASGYNGGGGNYVVMGTASSSTSREYKGFTATGVGNTFYVSFLLRLTAATATGDYFISLGDPTTGTTYGLKLFAKTSGAGYVLGVAKSTTVGSAFFGSTVLALNTTHLVVMRYDYVSGSANDKAYIWIDPSLVSEPLTSGAEASDTNASENDGWSSGNVGNFIWHNRSGNNPAGAFDGVRVAAASTSGIAWADLGASTAAAFPTVTTQAPSSPSTSGATLNGTVYSNGGASLSDRGFYWSTTSPVTTGSTQLSEGGTSVAAFSQALGSLAVNTIYYYRAYAVNSVGTAIGPSDVGFYTLANTPTAPTVNGPTTSTLNVAIGGGDGNPGITTYAIKEAGGQFVQASGALGALAVYQTAATWATTAVIGLSPGTPYSFTVQGKNGDGVTTAFGPSAGASTTAGTVIPTVTTQAASSPSTSGATLNGTVTADGGAALTDRGFYWSTTSPVTTGSTQLSEGGTSVAAFSQALTGQAVNTIVYFRAYAVNSAGTGIGASDVFFYTLANTPSAPTVSGAASTSVNVAIAAGDGNPATTTYAIQETTSGNYVQTSGSLSAVASYRTAAVWGSKKVIGLSNGTTYTFQAKARNGDSVDTAFGPTASGTTTIPLAAWDLTGNNTANATVAATLFNANLDSANTITRGPNAAASAAGNSFRTTGFKNDGIFTANDDYFQITLSGSPGYTLSLSTIDAAFDGTSSYYASPGVSAQFAYSLDGTTFTLIGSPFAMTSSGSMPQISLTGVSALQNVPPPTIVYIRYYASGQTATGGWGFSSPSAGSYGLDIGGSLTAHSLAPATITSISGTTLSYSGGAGTTFQLLQSTDVTLPMSSWSVVGTQSGTPGSFTIPAVGTGSPVFYRVQSE